MTTTRVLPPVVLAGLILFLPFRTDAESTVDSLCTKLATAPGNTNLLSQIKTQVQKTPDLDEKTRLASIYCLGCMYTGQTKEAETVQAYLKKNFPSHPNTSWLTDGSLRDTCQKCAGTGQTDLPCARCSGAGECKTCQGQGSRSIPTFNDSQNQRCPACNGTGRCKNCTGTGRTKATCPTCRGTGGPFSPSKVKTKYLAILKNQETQITQLASQSTSQTPLASLDTSDMDELLAKHLRSYAMSFKQKEFDELIFLARTDLDERDTDRKGWAKYEQQTRKIIEQTEAEKQNQEVAEAQAQTQRRREQEERQAREKEQETARREARAEREREESEEVERQFVAQAQAEQLAEEKRQAYWSGFLTQTKSMKRRNVAFEKALFEPEKYQNLVLVSTVQLVGAFEGKGEIPDQVWVHALGLGQTHILSCSHASLQKAQRARDVLGEHGVVTIEYAFPQETIKGIDFTGPVVPTARFIDLNVE
jgi:hypothetical protein